VFLDSRDFADCMQIAISIGGDTDTLAAIAGGVAEAFYRKQGLEGGKGIPPEFIDFADARLEKTMKEILASFYREYLS
jgi:ADP-ribosylglycohydrolase